MARVKLPQSTFLGFSLSPVQVLVAVELEASWLPSSQDFLLQLWDPLLRLFPEVASLPLLFFAAPPPIVSSSELPNRHTVSFEAQ